MTPLKPLILRNKKKVSKLETFGYDIMNYHADTQNNSYLKGGFYMFKKLNMLFICCLFCLFTSTASAESNFAIYPTQNYFTQLQLDTRDGQIWQVHVATTEDAFIGKLPINVTPLTDSPEPGRFLLSPTGNMYNFILLDTINGKSWQVQWSMKAENRFIISLN